MKPLRLIFFVIAAAEANHKKHE